MDATKRIRHEEFVSNLNGGSIAELCGLLFIPCGLGYCRVVLQHTNPAWNSPMKEICLDVAFVVASFILPITLLSEYILEIVIFSGGISFLLFWNTMGSSNLYNLAWKDPFRVWRRAARSYVIFCTCICIYAVDFPIFPRRFAKTENYGVSLMDTGVGLIAIMNGTSNVNLVLSCRSGSEWKCRDLLKYILPLIILAIGRTVVVKLIGYPEHVSEYGIHWNFFFTMAFLRIAGFFLSYFFRHWTEINTLNGVFILSFLTTIGHHAMIFFGLESILAFDSPLLTPESRKSSLILANVEGLMSLPGYLSLYMWGLFLGLLVDIHMGPSPVKYRWLSSQGVTKWRGNARKISLFIASMASTFLMIALYFGAEKISRRFVNLPYMSLQLFISYIISAFLLLCIFKSGNNRKRSEKDLMPLITSVADNTLVYFLVSNFLTGIFNLLIDTLVLRDLKPVWLSVLLQLGLVIIYVLGTPRLSEEIKSKLSSLF